LPILHIHVIYVLRQWMSLITPLDTLLTMRKNIGTIGFIPPHNIAALFGKLPQIAHNNANVAF